MSAPLPSAVAVAVAVPVPGVAAVLFDLDGLLIDSEPLWRAAEIEEFGAVGVALSEADCAETTGLRIDEVVAQRYALTPWPAALGSLHQVSERIIDGLIARVRSGGRALPGALAAVEAARARGVKVGLASSSARRIIEAAVDHLGLQGRFDALHSAEALPLGKPHPAVYLEIAEQLGVPAASCLAIEDSLNGVLAAKAARMRCLAVPEPPHRHDPRFSIADAVIDSLELLDDGLWRRLGVPDRGR